MNNELVKELDQTTQELLDAIDRFTPEQFNQVPYEGSWTAGQVAEHVYKAEQGLPGVWKGNKEATQRASDEKVGPINQILLNFDSKLQSPDFILPTSEPKDKDNYYHLHKSNRETIHEMAKTLDLDSTYTDFALPGLGTLTGKEGLAFMIAHSKRHINQLERIHKALV